MSGLSRSAVLAAIALAACAGEEKSTDIRSFFPADNEVSTWTLRETIKVGSPTTAYVETGLDGAIDPFVTDGLVQVARAYYEKGGAEIDLRVWEMRDAAAAQAVYVNVLQDGHYMNYTWENLTGLGEAARITQMANVYLWVNVRKGAYQVEALIQPIADPARDDVIAFITAVVAKIP
jgi:hypothetical protein